MDLLKITSPQTYDIILGYVGVIILISIIFPRILPKHLITAPIAYLILAVALFSLFSHRPLPHMADSPYLGKRLTELGVIISLTAAGLKLKAPFQWSTWRVSARLLAVSMPLTVFFVALFGWAALGMAPATAILLGAVIAPTDPVLASDVQTTPPLEDDVSSTRLALTSEAGLNDGLAFPFTNMAIAMALMGAAPENWVLQWVVNDVLYKISAGTAIGLAVGWLLARIIFLCPRPDCHNSIITAGTLSLSLTLVPYGLAELASSYGFIAVFTAACTFRHQESVHEYLTAMHDFSEQMERILVAVLFTVIGMYLSHDFLNHFQWYMVPGALVILLIIRPVSGITGLAGAGLPARKMLFISFYGIRGIGSLYYLLYAFHHAPFDGAGETLALVMTVVVLSLFLHGLSARAVIKKILPD